MAGILPTSFHMCTYCSYGSVWKFQLEHHILRNHKNIYAAELFHAIVEPEQYTCNCCDSKSFYRLGRCEHTLRHDDTGGVDEESIGPIQLRKEFERYPCDYCKYKGHSSLFLCKHHDSCEMVAKVSTTDDSLPITSKVASKDCKKSQDLISTSSVAKDFRCAQCPFKSKYSTFLKRHITAKHARSEEINWFNCSICSYRTKRKFDLKFHMLIHASADDIDWHSCAKCSYQTKYKTHLKRHNMFIHAKTDEINWFNCSTCSYRAKRKDHLKNHMLIHASAGFINWYNCFKCSYRAKRKGDLKTHMLTHATADEIIWFNCNKCPYRAKHKFNFNRHIQTHA